MSRPGRRVALADACTTSTAYTARAAGSRVSGKGKGCHPAGRRRADWCDSPRLGLRLLQRAGRRPGRRGCRFILLGGPPRVELGRVCRRCTHDRCGALAGGRALATSSRHHGRGVARRPRREYRDRGHASWLHCPLSGPHQDVVRSLSIALQTPRSTCSPALSTAGSGEPGDTRARCRPDRAGSAGAGSPMAASAQRLWARPLCPAPAVEARRAERWSVKRSRCRRQPRSPRP